MTKSIRYYCPLCLEAVGNLESHAMADHPEKIVHLDKKEKDEVLMLNEKPITLAPAFFGGPKGPTIDVLEIYQDETYASALNRASLALGIPNTKIMTLYCPFCAKTAVDVEEHVKEKHPEVKTKSVEGNAPVRPLPSF